MKHGSLDERAIYLENLGIMVGITMYLQLPFNSSSHLFYLHDLCKSQTCGLGPGGGLVSTPGVFSQFSELEENVL